MRQCWREKERKECYVTSHAARSFYSSRFDLWLASLILRLLVTAIKLTGRTVTLSRVDLNIRLHRSLFLQQAGIGIASLCALHRESLPNRRAPNYSAVVATRAARGSCQLNKHENLIKFTFGLSKLFRKFVFHRKIFATVVECLSRMVCCRKPPKRLVQAIDNVRRWHHKNH